MAIKKINSLADLTSDPHNRRVHTPRGVGLIEKALGDVGAARSIVIDEYGMVLAGNATIEAAAAAGIERVQVVDADGETLIAVRRTGLTDDQKVRLAIYDNRAPEFATWNPDQLLADVAAGIDLQGLFGKDDLDAILKDAAGYAPAADDPGADIDRAAELQEKWGTTLGQLWQIGRHRLLCGDCTVRENVERVMGGEKAGAVVTDPPYGIDAVGSDGRIGYAAKFGRIEGDMEPFNPAHLFTLSDNLVLWGGNHYADKLPASASWLVWDKRDGDRHNDLADCELAWCSGKGVVRIFSHLWMGYARASERDEKRQHPTQKPVVVMDWCLRERTVDGDIVIDPYLGSGTTMVAAQGLDRTCYGLELSPAYCAVILERMSGLGLTPELLS